jgi:hypothetical protein
LDTFKSAVNLYSSFTHTDQEQYQEQYQEHEQELENLKKKPTQQNSA